MRLPPNQSDGGGGGGGGEKRRGQRGRAPFKGGGCFCLL